MGVREIFILSDAQVEGAKNLPLITQRFFTLSFDPRSYDYLLFTSKRGVEAIECITDEWKKVPAFAIGEATAKHIQKLGGEVVGVANGYGKDLVQMAVQIAPKGRYLVIRPKKVATPIAQLLRKKGVRADEAVLYETICQECYKLKKPPKGSVIIFSSPSIVECFLGCFGWDKSYKAIAIGQKTAQVLPSFIQPYIPMTPSLQACVELAKKL